MNDPIMIRMKEYYESATNYKLTRRMPVIIRIDMRAGHTFTHGMDTPYDDVFNDAMHITAVELCMQISNARIAYIQSDEISILLTDYHKLTTEQWFKGQVQKIASVSASIATIEFNRAFSHRILTADPKKVENYTCKINKCTFDSRAFNIPQSDVCNYFIARQKDATKNSLNMLAQSIFTQDELKGKKKNDLMDMLMEKGLNWNDCPSYQKRGVCVFKLDGKWVLDDEIPVFTTDREYIEKWV